MGIMNLFNGKIKKNKQNCSTICHNFQTLFCWCWFHFQLGSFFHRRIFSILFFWILKRLTTSSSSEDFCILPQSGYHSKYLMSKLCFSMFCAFSLPKNKWRWVHQNVWSQFLLPSPCPLLLPSGQLLLLLWHMR